MSEVDGVKAINKVTFGQRLKAYKRSKLSFLLAVLVLLSAIITIGVLGYLIFYILIKGVPNLSPDLFSLTYTSENVSMIPAIINTLIEESEKSVDTMKNVKEVIDKQDVNVTNTQDAFNKVKDGIDRSVEGIREIAKRTAGLDEARIKVVDIVQNLTAIAEENAASTEETSASAEEVNAVISNIAANANNLHEIAVSLEDCVKMFIFE